MEQMSLGRMFAMFPIGYRNILNAGCSFLYLTELTCSSGILTRTFSISWRWKEMNSTAKYNFNISSLGVFLSRLHTTAIYVLAGWLNCVARDRFSMPLSLGPFFQSKRVSYASHIFFLLYIFFLLFFTWKTATFFFFPCNIYFFLIFFAFIFLLIFFLLNCTRWSVFIVLMMYPFSGRESDLWRKTD